MNKDLGIGFIDLLTGFLCSTIVLMLIYSYSKNKSANQNEATDSFFLIEFKVNKNQTKLRFTLKNRAETVWNKIDDRNDTIVGGFNDLNTTTSEKVYMWGPTKSSKDDYHYYKVYSPGISRNHFGEWEIMVNYYDDERLKEQNNISSVVKTPSMITYNIITREGVVFENEKLQLKLGEEDPIKFKVN